MRKGFKPFSKISLPVLGNFIQFFDLKYDWKMRRVCRKFNQSFLQQMIMEVRDVPAQLRIYTEEQIKECREEVKTAFADDIAMLDALGNELNEIEDASAEYLTEKKVFSALEVLGDLSELNVKCDKNGKPLFKDSFSTSNGDGYSLNHIE